MKSTVPKPSARGLRKLASSIGVLIAGVALATTLPARAEELLLINWHNLSIVDAARLTSQATGRTIRVPPGVKATISMASEDPINADQVFDLFQSALRERGLAAAPTGPHSFEIRPASTVAALKNEKEAAPAAAQPSLSPQRSGPDSPTLQAGPNPVVTPQSAPEATAIAPVSPPITVPSTATPVVAAPAPAPAAVAPAPATQVSAPLPASVQPATPPTASPAPAASPVAVATAAPVPAAVRAREEVLAIFSTANRAQGIVNRLKQNGGDAMVRAGTDPSDPSFAVVLRFPDTPDGYRSAAQTIEAADLAGLVALPAPH